MRLWRMIGEATRACVPRWLTALLTWALGASPKKGLCPMLCPSKPVSALAQTTTDARLWLCPFDSSLQGRPHRLA